MPGGMTALKDIRLYKKKKRGETGGEQKGAFRAPPLVGLNEVGAKLKAAYTSSLRPHTLVA